MTACVSATWTSPTGAQCVATGSGGHSIVMDAPNGRADWAGFKPSELLLAALLGCAGVDFTSILTKQRQLTLAVERYCSVGATLAGTATISHRAVVMSADAERVAA